jgi:hypothetical protein
VQAAVNWTPVGNEVSVTSGLQNVIKNIPDGSAEGIKANTSFPKILLLKKQK